jgi:hypothetical protein
LRNRGSRHNRQNVGVVSQSHAYLSKLAILVKVRMFM